MGWRKRKLKWTKVHERVKGQKWTKFNGQKSRKTKTDELIKI
jgi:hypothetical protein